MAKNSERIIFGEPEREITDDVARVEANQSRANLQQAINRLNEQGWHNQFDYANYGVQYNPIYDKDTGRVRSVEESGLSPQEYSRLSNMMASSPELTDEWNEDRAVQIASKIFDNLDKNDIVAKYRHAFANKEEFIKAYVEAVKKYHQDDEDFNYEVIKSLYMEHGGSSTPGYDEKTERDNEPKWASSIGSKDLGI